MLKTVYKTQILHIVNSAKSWFWIATIRVLKRRLSYHLFRGTLLAHPTPETVVDFEDAAADADEEKYEKDIDHPEGASKSRLTEQKTEGRPRGLSFTSSFIAEYVPGL